MKAGKDMFAPPLPNGKIDPFIEIQKEKQESKSLEIQPKKLKLLLFYLISSYCVHFTDYQGHATTKLTPQH